MPAPRQQRKAAAGSKVKTSQQHTSSNISSFARVSKTVGHAAVKKELVAPSTPKKEAKLEAITPASRKRRAVTSIEDESSADESINEHTTASSVKKLASTTATPVKRGRGRPPKKARPEPTPTPRKRVRSPSVSDSDASTVDTGALFKKLRLESSPSRFSSPVTADTSIAGSDIEPDTTTPRKPNELPEEVLDLINLHAGFLKTLTLHYAHNGSNVPADLRVLCPNIARAWGKKKVTDADIRVCLGVLGCSTSSTPNSSSPFTLSNYGRGKICIEINQSRNSGPSLSEDKLNTLFRTNITSLWSKFLTDENENGSASQGSRAFLPTLPKAPVTLCESLAKASSLTVKGQQRLEDLKHGIAIKKQEKATVAKSVSTTTTRKDTPMMNADGTKMSLLDRIRLKSQLKSAMPAGLSPAQLERRGALQRVEEVSALIGMLSRASGDGGRVSFTMAALVEKLKDSFRMGISKQEGAVCVRLLASEVAPEWVRVVTLSGRENVVVEVSCQLGKPEVARRVRDILARQ
ncbi:hypothetical protein F4678DRAFT_345834 [Xylaria arbuscula]|nr:hypothetical protein F4678DRAFT_345834 [Xylaria arbuscula]